MRKLITVLCLLFVLGVFTLSAVAQSVAPFDFPQARLNGLTLPEGTRYVLILPYNNSDALYNFSVTVDLPLGSQLISAQQSEGVNFVGASANETAYQLFWRAPEILSGNLFAPFTFTLTQPITTFIPVKMTWRDSLNEAQSAEILLLPNTLNAVGQGASFNPEAPIPAEQFTFIGDTGVVIYTSQELPASAISVREMTPEENPPAEMGDFWWCSGLELQGAGGVTVYVPLRRPLPPLMPLTLFAQEGGVWRILDVQGYVSADGLYAVYDHPGGVIFTGTEAENQPAEAPPAPPPPPDSDGDGRTDDVDSCPNQGDAGFGLDGNGCPLPPPDSDGDGFVDPNDACPNQGDAGFGLGGDGCPLQPPPPPPDSDGDGRPDNADSCPNEGDLGFGIDGDGCANPPPPDSDGDGIPDFGDTCPTEGDLGLGLNSDGCPILPPLDSDADGLPDATDACPNQADGGFGLTADGCPLLPTFTPTSEIPAPTEVPSLTPTATTPPLPTPIPPQLVRFDFPQFTVIFGNTAQAVIEIAEPAPADVRVLIQPLAGANNIRFTAPSEVIIPAGQTSATVGIFAEENRRGFVTIQATPADNPTSRLVANVLVQPLTLVGVTVNTNRFLPNQLGSGTVQMSAPTEFDTSIQLVSNSPDIILNPLVMPAGQTSVSFEFTVAPVVTTPEARFTATFGDTAIFGTQSVSSGVLELKSQVNYQVVLPETISTPGDYVGEIVLLDPVLSAPSTFALSSPRPDVVVSADVTLPAGVDRVPFTITVADGGINEDVVINALELSTGTLTSGTFRLHTLRIQSVAFAEASLTTGLTSVARVTLNAPVPSGVAELTISFNNAEIVPNLTPIDVEAGLYALQIAQGESTAQFDVSVAPSVTEDTSVTMQAIFPSDVSASASADVLGGVRIVSFDFGTEPIVPGRGATGRITLNIPAPENIEIRIAPLDTTAFAFSFPQRTFISAGTTSTDLFFGAFGSFSNSRVGFIAHLASQTPAEGVTGFFDISVLQVTSVQLSSPVIASDTPSNLTVRFNQPMPANSRVFIQAFAPNGQLSGIVSVLNNPVIPTGATEITLPLTFNPTQFPNAIVNDTLPIRLSVSLGVTIPAAGMIPVETTIQARPTLIIDTIASSISTSTSNGGNSFTTTPIFASDATMPNLVVRFRGVSTTVGGTIRVSSGNPEFVIPSEETVQVPPNTSTISIPLKLINSNFSGNTQTITFTVTDANGGNVKTVQIPFSKPNLSSISISEFNNFAGTSLQANVLSNTNFTLTCGTPCYLSVGTNGTFISNRPEAPGRTATTPVSLGSPFKFASFDADERLTTTLTAQVADIQRTATHISRPAGTLSGSLSTQQNLNNQPYLSGSVNLSNTSMSGVTLRLESSLPSVIPPAFYNQANSDCNITGVGGSSRSLSFNSFTFWCMDIREEAVSQPTSVTITYVVTSTERGMTHTSRKSFTIVVSPSGSVATQTPTRTPIPFVQVATPLPVENAARNVIINIATNTPTPTLTPTPTPTATPFVVQQAFFVVQTLPTPVPVSLSVSVNTSTRRGTVSIASSRSTNLVINLSSSNSRIIGVPSSVTIPSGSRSVSFDYTVNTSAVVISPTTVRITVSGGGDSATASITIRR